MFFRVNRRPGPAHTYVSYFSSDSLVSSTSRSTARNGQFIPFSVSPARTRRRSTTRHHSITISKTAILSHSGSSTSAASVLLSHLSNPEKSKRGNRITIYSITKLCSMPNLRTKASRSTVCSSYSLTIASSTTTTPYKSTSSFVDEPSCSKSTLESVKIASTRSSR